MNEYKEEILETIVDLAYTPVEEIKTAPDYRQERQLAEALGAAVLLSSFDEEHARALNGQVHALASMISELPEKKASHLFEEAQTISLGMLTRALHDGPFAAAFPSQAEVAKRNEIASVFNQLHPSDPVRELAGIFHELKPKRLSALTTEPIQENNIEKVS